MENNEVTLRIKGDIESFKKDLEKKGFIEKEHCILDDSFMVPEYLKIEELSIREIISKAIIIRKVEDIAHNEIRRDISFKIKKINDNGEIIEQKSTRLKILNCQEAEEFFKVIGYKKIMSIYEEDYGYQKGKIFLMTKDIKDGDKMIEAETQPNNQHFNTIDKIKQKLMEENLNLCFEDCFVKKAEVELKKILKR